MASAITNKGVALLAKLIQGKELDITCAKTGAGTVDATLLEEQTGVTTPKQTVTITGVTYLDDGMCALVLSITNKGVSSGYTIKQIGIYANDPDEGEVLFSIWQVDSGSGINIQAESVLPGYNAELHYNIKLDQADSVNVTLDPSNTVSQAAMEAYVKEKVGTAKQDVAAHTANKQNPHGVTAEQLGLAKVATSGSYNDLSNKPTIPTIPSSLPANGGNADTLEGKHADEFAPADHATNKNNPHGVTAAQVGTVLTGDIPNLHIWEKHSADPKGYEETSVSEAIVGQNASGIAQAYCSSDIRFVDGKVIGNFELITASAIADFNVIKGKYVLSNMLAHTNHEYYYVPEDAVLTKVSTGVSIRPAVLLSPNNSELLGYVASKVNSTYPTNGARYDGYWYKYIGQLGEVPYSYGTADLAAGVSPLATGKLYFVYE